MNRHNLAAVMASLLGVLLPASESAAQDVAAKRGFPFVNRGNGFALSPKVLLAADGVSDGGLRKQSSASVDGADELLPPDRAFTVSISAKDADNLVAVFTPAEGYFLYRDKFIFRVQQPPGIEVANVAIPRGEIKDDPIFGKTEVFHRPVRVRVHPKRTNSSARSLMLYVRYQGCNEPLAVCYIPIEKTLRITLPPAARGG